MKDISEYNRPNTVSGLTAKRKELTAFLVKLSVEAKQVQENIKHVDACIAMRRRTHFASVVRPKSGIGPLRVSTAALPRSTWWRPLSSTGTQPTWAKPLPNVRMLGYRFLPNCWHTIRQLGGHIFCSPGNTNDRFEAQLQPKHSVHFVLAAFRWPSLQDVSLVSNNDRMSPQLLT